MKNETYTIDTSACNGEENDFENWMNENYPEIETSQDLHSAYYVDGKLTSDNFWEEYCNS